MNKNRISQAFADGKKAFIGFITGGDPSLEKTEEFILEMVRAGTDLVEIGIPFSDPIAEGPVIQAASQRALAAGTTTDKLFALVESVRKKTDVPIVFMTYLNPVFVYGYERFCQRCEDVGVDGIIVPDLPFEEKGELAPIARRHGVAVISLIAPTSEERIAKIAAQGEGFLYVVSSMGVTGVRSEIRTDLASILAAVRKSSSVPAAVGFGINTPEQVQKIWGQTDGVIVGSALVKIIESRKEAAGPYIYDYIRELTASRDAQ